MKRTKRLTKREKKALTTASRVAKSPDPNQHIHCIACGRHIDRSEFQSPAAAVMVQCQHGSQFASCLACVDRTKKLLAEHDRTGSPVATAAAWH
jgi:hypothetical protein